MKCQYFLTVLVFSFLFFSSRVTAIEHDFTDDSEQVSIDWFVESPIRASRFPVGLFSNKKANYTISTSWDFITNGTLFPDDEPSLIWISLPANSSEGEGMLRVFSIPDIDESFSVTWKKKLTTTLPTEVHLTYSWFSYWAGRTRTILKVFSNLTMDIQFRIDQLNNEFFRKDLLYNESFSFTTPLSENKWMELVNFLLLNDCINWQSWTYPTPTTNHPVMAMCDGGGFRISSTLVWNESINVSYSELIDNDGCTGQRIYTLPSAKHFNTLLMDMTDEAIQRYFASRSTTTEKFIPSFSFLSISLLFLFFIPLKRFIKQ
jgi:hypothetical protein